jgi:N-acetylneuraminic acid mutarotase
MQRSTLSNLLTALSLLVPLIIGWPGNKLMNAMVQSDVWMPVTVEGAPSPRVGFTAVWTGQEMIVWGGNVTGQSGSLFTSVNSGGRYDPVTDSWKPTSLEGAPSPRTAHTAIWTGQEMIVWGGSVGSNLTRGEKLNTGGRYDPVTDTWKPMSTVNAPSPRNHHTAVWTGEEMIVWGGTDGVSQDGTEMILLPTGARYNPRTDTWVPITSEGAPEGRFLHAAVWTGQEMIIWGGQIGLGAIGPTVPGPSNTGGRYDPATDTWTPVTTRNAPQTSVFHTVVWTGQEMIVWGGLPKLLSREPPSPRRYDPRLDRWLPVSLVSSPPSSMADHTAIWTGNEMIVWGGSLEDGSLTNIGGCYDPVSDTWSLTTLVGAPQPRGRHEAVWTGEEMIIWGGSGVNRSLDLLNSGGRYTP